MREIIEKLPKTDLHVHLDGSIRVDTLIELAKKENLQLPADSVEELNKVLFKDNYQNLGEYLTCFGYTVPVMQTPENLERISYEFAMDNINENVCYVEVRFAPQLHINAKMNLKDVLVSVNNGLAKAQSEYNNTKVVKENKKPRFMYGIIVCAMRYFGGFSEYYRKFLDVHPFSTREQCASLASMELVQGVINIRDELNIPIVGFDLAGQEDGYPARDHIAAYQLAHENFLHKTVHAGEAYGAESIFQAITDLHADRIGHGYYLFDVDKITDPEITDKKKFIEKLAQFIAEKRTTIEVCLTSNLQTNPNIGELKNHNFRLMRDAKLSTTFCTDNRTVSKTTVTNEIVKAIDTFNLTISELKDIFSYGFKRSFYHGTYFEKRKYVKEVLDYYDKIMSGFTLR